MDNKPSSLFDYFQEEILNEQLQCDVSNDEKSIDGILKTDEKNSTINRDTDLNEYNNCDFMLKAFDDAFETIYGDSEIDSIQIYQISEELQTNCVRLINMAKNGKDSIEVESLKSKYAMLENESLTTINKLKCQVAELKLQLKQQSAISSIIGTTFGYYLWQATQVPVVIDMVLQKDKIRNMAKLMNSILVSFIETYNNKMPSIETCETKFVLNILGIIANLTTTRAGCYFFSQVNDGINIINLILSLVLHIPPSLQNSLKKIAYATLYNVSIQFNGHLLMENNKLVETLYNDIITMYNNNINDTLIFALKLLHSLTTNINESMYTILKKEVQLEEIFKLTRHIETKSTARKIYENINFASEKYDTF